jgi:hypothetical protein
VPRDKRAGETPLTQSDLFFVARSKKFQGGREGFGGAFNDSASTPPRMNFEKQVKKVFTGGAQSCSKLSFLPSSKTSLIPFFFSRSAFTKV